MRDRRTDTIENSAVTKKALIAINKNTASSRERISEPLNDEIVLVANIDRAAGVIRS
jgi:hypothetical protein